MSKRAGVLELAILGLLHESPMHGYELRKRLNTLLGSFRAFSYGSLYPCLKDLLAKGWITEDASSADNAPVASALPSKRSKIVYKLTAEGKEHFQRLLSDSGPSAWEDENFGVHFAFFARTDAAVRMRILEGRRSRLEERLDRVRTSLARTRERLDGYTLELQRHGLESVEREVRWLNELIATERRDDSASSSSRREAGSKTGAALRPDVDPGSRPGSGSGVDAERRDGERSAQTAQSARSTESSTPDVASDPSVTPS